VEQAIRRGLFFELVYGVGIEVSVSRRQQLFSNITSLATAARGKNLVFSSGTEKPSHLRGPHDVANLAVVLGIKQVSRLVILMVKRWMGLAIIYGWLVVDKKQEKAMASLSINCSKAVAHGKARRLGWLPVEVTR